MAIFSAAAVGAFFGLAKGAFIASLGAFALNAAVSAGLSYAAQAIAGKGKQPSIGTVLTLQSGGEVPRSFGLGLYCTAGSAVYANTWGRISENKNVYITQVIALSDLHNVALQDVIIDGDYVTLDYSNPHPEFGIPVEEYRASPGDFCWVKFYDGTQTQADPFLINRVSTSFRPYEATRVGRGVAYAIVTARLAHNEGFWTGYPKLKFVLRGACYDITKDSTQGGTGPQRIDDIATWGGDGDLLPACHIYTLMRGVRYDGEWLYGLQNMPAARLPSDNWRAQVAKCRAPIEENDETVPTYRAGSEIAVTVEPVEAIEAFATACQGRVSEAGGIYKLHVGAPGASVASITDGDILSTSEQTFTPFLGLAETINGIAASYPSQEGGWNYQAAPPRYSPEFEAEDGNRRLMADVRFDCVPYAEQVQRLQRSALEEARRARRHTITLPPEYWKLEPGDVIDWTSLRNGYEAKLLRVDGVMDLPNCDVIVDITEVDPADYDWTSATDFTPVISGRIRIQPVEPIPGDGVEWSVSPSSIDGRRPAILLTWPDDVGDVRGVVYQARIAGQTAIAQSGQFETYEDGQAPISGDAILPDTTFEVRARFLRRGQGGTLWTGWMSVTTDDLRLTRADVADDLREEFEMARELLGGNIETIIGVIGDLRDRIRDVIAPITGPGLPTVPHIQRLTEEIAAEVAERAENILATAGSIRLERDRIRRVAQELMEAAAHGEGERQEIRREMSVELGAVRAEFTEVVTLLAGEEFALAQQVIQLVAETEALAAQIALVNTARVDGDNALASQIALLSVGSAVQFDHVSIWYWDAAVEGWTGSPSNPTVSGDGWLVPAGYVVSPAGLAVDSAAYRQVRARLRNEPGSWASAYLYWAAAGQGWDNARRVAIDDPGWDGDESSLTINPDWSGAIDRIRVDLPAGVEIDWLAVGRPAPGASSADIASERLARISGDEALASSILALTAELTSAAGDITANADALQSLTARVTETEDGITSLVEAQTAIQSGITNLQNGQTALSQAVDNLETLTVDIEDALRTQSRATRAVRSGAALRNSDILEALTQALGRDGEVREVVATATQDLRTEIEVTNDQIRIIAEAVTQLQAAIPGLATASALQILATAVTATETGIEALSQSLTQLEVTVGSNTGAINTLASTRITEAEAEVIATQVIQASLNNGAIAAAIQAVASLIIDETGIEAITAQVIQASLNSSAGGTIGGEIAQVAALIVDEAGVSGIIDTRIEATFDAAGRGEITSLAEFSLWAVANADGSSSGFRFALNGNDVITAVSVREDGTVNPAIAVRIGGNSIFLDGNTQITGNFLVEGQHVQLSANTTISGYLGSATFNNNTGWRINANGTAEMRAVTVSGTNGYVRSANFVAGVSGFNLHANGNAEFNSLNLRAGIIGREPIQIGAISDVELFSAQAQASFSGTSWETVETLTLGEATPAAIGTWTATWSTDLQSVNHIIGTDSYTKTAQYRIQQRKMTGGTWGSWETLSEYASTSLAWTSAGGSSVLLGPFQEAQLRYQWSTGSTGQSGGGANFRNRSLLAQRITR